MRRQIHYCVDYRIAAGVHVAVHQLGMFVSKVGKLS